MTVINTNISAILAQNSARTSGLKLATAMERLSTGVRINAAKDDAAGLAISTRMTAEIKGLAGAVRNANDGISLTQTAEGALESINNNLQRIRELAVQSSNSTNSASDRMSLHNEARQLVDEIDRVALNSTFNGIKLLDGSFSGMALQVGSGNSINDRLTLSIANAQSAALGARQNDSYSRTTSTVSTAGLSASDLSINGTQVGATVSDGLSFANDKGSAIAKANAINAVSGTTGVWATVGAATMSAVTAPSTASNFSFNVNGVIISGATSSTTPAVGASEIAAAFNAVSSKTGVTASVSGDTYTLKASDGRNIALDTGAASTTGAAGTTAATTFSFTLNGQTVTATTGTTAATNGTAIATAINAVTAQTGVKATASTTGALTLSSVTGGDINVVGADANTYAGLTVANNLKTSTAAQGTVTLTSSNKDGITVGGSGATALGGAAGITSQAAYRVTAQAQNMKSGVAGVDLSSIQGSQDALATLDSAITTITNSRASLGAYQNRLTAAISNIETSSMNLQASRSRIMDTDYASETTNLAKAQIISQAATAMLAQANQSAQSVLSLLK